ncbi:DUF6452 family protein [Thalassobellus suaedae]|uniref:DUF6452 family protein n=1 Tax=Thalassobellus suaedae TaxID=3074124 RepID=A0ABY9Y1F2_9FLAO|nr:DUF6452 family protein [Flavobacteriaceae bacterium HL-DH10]
MKKISLLVIIIITTIAYISCERDDICPENTPTTPNLIVNIYNAENIENKKNATNLLIIGVNNEEALGIYTSTNNIVLPLNTNEDTTQYILHNNYKVNNNGTPDDPSDDYAEGNQDIITINYTREDVYVSRACGYKTVFKNVTFNIEPDTDNWIESSQPTNDNQSVEDEEEAHYIIFY